MMRILIAEDDPVSRRVLEASLTKRGYDVVVASDGLEAWDVLQRKDRPELAILDWMMPGLDGVDVCRELRAQEDSGSYVYTILLTAKGRKEDVAAGLDAGADDYITKPFNARELHARVEVGIRIITLQKELQDHVEKLQELDKMKSEFITVVSHELRSPVAIMREGVALCLDGLLGEITDSQREFLSDTLNNIDRLARLVTDLLDISKIEAGKVRFRKHNLDISDLARQVVTTFKHSAHEKEITLEAQVPDESVMLNADSDKITQVFNNLVSNAIRFTDAGGTITLRIQENEEGVHCSVSDTGCGIAKEDIPKLFSKFEQFGRVETGEYKGTGLGLVIAKGLVESHGGRMWVDSEQGKGSTFHFTLKREFGPSVLVVDDEPTIVDVVSRYLEHDAYQISSALDGPSAVEMARREKPSVIVLDMMLPGMNGYEVIGQLKQDKATHDIPIVILSGFPVDTHKIEAFDTGAAIPVLTKPIESDVLRDTVRDVLLQ